jgi:hypothetical protein
MQYICIYIYTHTQRSSVLACFLQEGLARLDGFVRMECEEPHLGFRHPLGLLWVGWGFRSLCATCQYPRMHILVMMTWVYTQIPKQIAFDFTWPKIESGPRRRFAMPFGPKFSVINRQNVIATRLQGSPSRFRAG